MEVSDAQRARSEEHRKAALLKLKNKAEMDAKNAYNKSPPRHTAVSHPNVVTPTKKESRKVNGCEHRDRPQGCGCLKARYQQLCQRCKFWILYEDCIRPEYKGWIHCECPADRERYENMMRDLSTYNTDAWDTYASAVAKDGEEKARKQEEAKQVAAAKSLVNLKGNLFN